VAVLTASIATASDAAHAPDVPEPGSVEAIAEATTDPKFLNPWVAYVPPTMTRASTPIAAGD
jgi:hypothetical protein